MRVSVFATAVGVALLGTIAAAQNVTYDFDRAVDFAKFKTYSWVGGANLADELNHQRVVRAVDAQLVSKGLARVDAGTKADLHVRYHANFDKNLRINAYSSGWGPGRFAMRSGTATTEEIVTGTLVIDVIDATSGTIIWRGMANGDVDPTAKPAERDKKITKAATKVFKNYPPQR
jgi:hypothetical protein